MTINQNSYLAVDQNGNFITEPTNLEEALAAFAAEFLDRPQLSDLPKVEPLIEGVYGRHSYIILAGQYGTYKSFIALDFALCHATGKQWLGTHNVVPGRVLYLAGEGAYGLEDRVSAWEKHYGTKVPPGMFITLPRIVRLFNNAAELRLLLEYIRRGCFVLVIIDTLRRASGEAKENSNDDMGQVVDVIEDIKRSTDNGSVLVIAHTDAEDTKVRGATNIPSDADFIYRVKRTSDNQVKLWRTKNKYGPEEDNHNLRTRLVGESLVLETDTVQVMRIGDRDQAEAKILFDAIDSAGGSIKGFASLRGRGVDNNRIKPAVTWLADRGYVEIREDKKPYEYVKLRDWGSQ